MVGNYERDAIRTEWEDALHDMNRTTMMRFCSMAGNCEFGIAQRKYGAEPLDLLRWSNTRVEQLMHMLEARFEGIAGIEVETLPHGEYRIRNAAFNITYHAFANTRTATVEEVRRREVNRLPFLARKLVEDLEASERIFVVKLLGNRLPDLPRMRAAADLYGSPRFLLVTEGAEPSVAERDGFLWGTVPAFARGAMPQTTDAATWLRLCEIVLAHHGV